MELHEFEMRFWDGAGGGHTARYSLVLPSGHRPRVRHRVVRLVQPELPDDDPDDGSAIVEDWIELDDWNG